MENITYKTSYNEIKRIIEEYEQKIYILKPNNEVFRQILDGNYHVKGFRGKVTIHEGKAYKLNVMKIPSDFTGNYIFAERSILQNIIPSIIDSILKNTELNNTYLKFVEMFRYDEGMLSVYEQCNIGTLQDVILENKHNPEILDKILVNCIKRISKSIGVLYNKYGFVHNDLKSNNVMLHDNNGEIEYKMIDFDSSYIKLKNGTIITNNRDPIEENDNLTQTIIMKNKTEYTIKSKLGLGFRGMEDEGKIFRRTYKKSVNIDIYTLILSILFNKHIVEIIDDLPLLNTLITYIFNDKDVEKISLTMHNKLHYSFFGIYGPMGYLIVNKIILKKDIYKIIDSFQN